MENWVNICEFNQKESAEWLLKLLDEEKIPHKEEFKENWYGHRMPKYEQNIWNSFCNVTCCNYMWNNNRIHVLVSGLLSYIC